MRRTRTGGPCSPEITARLDCSQSPEANPLHGQVLDPAQKGTRALSGVHCSKCHFYVKAEPTDKVAELFRLDSPAAPPSATTICWCRVGEDASLEDTAKVKHEFAADKQLTATGALRESGEASFRCVDGCPSPTDKRSWWRWLILCENCSKGFHPECVLAGFETENSTPNPTQQKSILGERRFFCPAQECQDAQARLLATAHGTNGVKRERGALTADNVGVDEELKCEQICNLVTSSARWRVKKEAFRCVDSCPSPTDKRSWWRWLILCKNCSKGFHPECVLAGYETENSTPNPKQQKSLLGKQKFFCPALECQHAQARLPATAHSRNGLKRQCGERGASVAVGVDDEIKREAGPSKRVKKEARNTEVITIPEESNDWNIVFIPGDRLEVDTAAMNLHPLPVVGSPHLRFKRRLITACLGGSEECTFPRIAAKRYQITQLDGGQRVEYATLMPDWNPDLPTAPGHHGSYMTSRAFVVREARELFPRRPDGWEYLGTYNISKFRVLRKEGIATLSEQVKNNFARGMIMREWGQKVLKSAGFEDFPKGAEGIARAGRELRAGNIPLTVGLLECIGFNYRLRDLLVRAEANARFFNYKRHKKLASGEWERIQIPEDDVQEEDDSVGVVAENERVGRRVKRKARRIRRDFRRDLRRERRTAPECCHLVSDDEQEAGGGRHGASDTGESDVGMDDIDDSDFEM
ncbi:hypothetical protein HDU88_004139 [Geranomyces variabilis]|nr:hypothetical protein HDU88_004139 [Geranomyces variabilis]